MSCELCRNYDFSKTKIIITPNDISILSADDETDTENNKIVDFQYCPLCGRKLKTIELAAEPIQYTGEAEQIMADAISVDNYTVNTIYETDEYKWYIDSQGYLHKFYVTEDAHRIQYDKLMPNGTWFSEQTLIYNFDGEAMYYYNNLK